MLRVDREQRTLGRLGSPTLTDAQILERSDLQEFIFNSSPEFFEEIGEHVFLLGKEIAPSQTVKDRIDLLGVDADGHVVVVELKRGSDKLHMLQAISYAAMVSRWQGEEFRSLLTESQWEALVDFLDVEVEEVNRTQRILLIAEGYDFALLSAAEWLSEHYGVDIRCAAVSLATDSATGAEYLACSSVFPPPALAEQAAARAQSARGARPMRWADWEEALADVSLQQRVFVEHELADGRETYLRRRGLHYRVNGKRRWSLNCRRRAAYVWQRGRFEDDEAFWKDRLSDAASVSPVKADRCLSFRLWTEDDFAAFRQAAVENGHAHRWLAVGELEDGD